MRSILVLTLMLGVRATVAVAAEPVAVSFDELPKIVGQKNQHVRGAELFLKAAESQTGHLTRSYLPSLEAYAGGERFETGDFAVTSQPYGGVETRVNLFRGGRDLLEERAREAQVRASQASFRAAYIDELTKAREAFWQLVYQREMVRLLTEALAENARNLAAANKRIGSGLATETDRIEFEMYRVQLEQDLARATLGSANSQRTLNVLLGLPENTELRTTEAIPHDHDEALLTATLEAPAHRDVRGLLANQEIASARKKEAYRWWTPSVDAYAGYALYTLRERDFVPRSDRDEAVVGLRLTLNIFDGLQARTAGAGYSLEADAYENQAQQTGKELLARFEGAKQELRLTHDLIHSAERSVDQATKYLSRTHAEYVRGVKNSPDVFSATEKYIDLRRRFAEIRRDYQMAKTELLAILGR